jgi:hypothetical protein
MLRYVSFVRTGVSKELSASFIRMTRIGELGTKLAVTSNRSTLPFFMEISSSETSVHMRWQHPELPLWDAQLLLSYYTVIQFAHWINK